MHYLLKSLFLITFLFSPSCVDAQDGHSMMINMSYHKARKIVLENSWGSEKSANKYEDIGASAKYFRDLGYDEVEDCAGSGLLICTFYFQNEKGEFLRIETAGEYTNPSFDLDTRVVHVSVQTALEK